MVGVVTETWMNGDNGEVRERLSEEAGIGFLSRNRTTAAAKGQTYGGVALLWRENACSARRINFPNPGDFEVLPAAGSVRGHSRKLIILACYLPSNYSKQRSADELEHINDLIVHVERKFTDPFIIIAGDFNPVSYTHLTLPTTPYV